MRKQALRLIAVLLVLVALLPSTLVAAPQPTAGAGVSSERADGAVRLVVPRPGELGLEAETARARAAMLEVLDKHALSLGFAGGAVLEDLVIDDDWAHAWAR